MTDPTSPHPDDDRLLRELGRVLDARDPVPDAVRTAAHAALDWRTVDAELAALVADTAAGDELALVRSGEAEVLLSFAAAELSIELEVGVAPGGRTLAGQLLPAQPASVRLERPAGDLELIADDRGRFSAAGLAPGPARLRVRLSGGRDVATPWTVL
jgi:hypothetical protein